MRTLLYITADEVGADTGGGSVTGHESLALREFAKSAGAGAAVEIWSSRNAERPWGADAEAAKRLRERPDLRPALAHLYSGTFTETVRILRERGCKVAYSAAAHSIKISREEHEARGLPFPYPHLTEPDQWSRYVEGYLLADAVVCPSSLSAGIMREHGCRGAVVIPHGVRIPPATKAPPGRFSVASLGQLAGPDKGVVHLLRAWKLLGYADAVLTIAGYGTEALLDLVRQEGGGSIYLRGTVPSVGDVYDACSLYVQPSASEGFGIEVLEAMAHARPVVCSDGAGACEVVKGAGVVVPKRDPKALAEAIDAYRRKPERLFPDGEKGRALAEAFAWDKIRARYCDLWRSMLA